MRFPPQSAAIKALTGKTTLYNPSTILHKPSTSPYNPSTILHNPSTIQAPGIAKQGSGGEPSQASPIKRTHPSSFPRIPPKRLKNCRGQRSRKIQQAACKPNFVEDDHSSRRRITASAHSDLPAGLAHRAGTRAAACAATLPAYLVLLRVGFTMPPTLQPKRCALTAPFHPYRILADAAVSSLWHLPSRSLDAPVPDVIRHTALRSSDFPLLENFAAFQQRSPSRLLGP